MTSDSQSGGMAGRITATGTRIAYENRWMRVREDAIVRADGTPGIYGVVEKPDFAVIIPRQGDRYTLVQQYRYPVGRRMWEFPQGMLETAPQADPLEVARTELREETGLTAGRMRHLGHTYVASGYSSQGCNVFLAEDLTAGTSDREAEEQDLVTGSFDRAALEAMIAGGTIKDATSIAAYGLLMLNGER